MTRIVPTASHWGNYRVETQNGRIAAIHNYAEDRDPTPIGQSLIDAQDPDCRIPRPMVRQGYLDGTSDGSGRGIEPFVPVDWETAVSLAATALDSARKQHGNESIYGGSYGWASAGRFHHAQSQLHRFLNQFGGYTSSRNSYSAGAAEVIVGRILGMVFFDLMFQAPTVADMCEHTGLAVCFGGIAMKNTQIMQGGLGAHTARDQLDALHRAGVKFVNVSPIRDDMTERVEAEWLPVRPNSDVALMLALAHTLYREGRHDEAFLDKYCVGFDRFLPYLLGATDGQPKDAGWAEALTDIPADAVRALARRMAATRTVIGVSWSLQRSEFGEQTYWMATVLAAMLGTHGLRGGGVAYGYGSVHNIGFSGRGLPPFRVGAFPQGRNPVQTFIPVSRIADMLLNPGAKIDYDGSEITFPDIKVIYWAGGNPFHHHQDLTRLRKAWAKPETIIVNEPWWTGAARHSDIVFPCNTPLERNDISASSIDCHLTPMVKAVDSFGESLCDFEIYSLLSEKLGFRDEFTEGRTEMEWVEHLYAVTRKSALEHDIELPEFDAFWAGEQFSVADKVPNRVFDLEAFRNEPDANPLKTPSGKIEVYSSTIASFGYDDCRGHPMWFDGEEWLGAERANEYPLHLLSNQPKKKLHSQYDHGVASREAKIREREIVRMNPTDAAERGLADGDIVRVFNDRGSCLAAALTHDGIRQGVVELPTGAWYDPENLSAGKLMDVHGNPNVLTRDKGSSKLAQSTTAHSCLVEIERFSGDLPEIKAFRQPATTDVGGSAAR